MHSAWDVVERARAWVLSDDRVLGALVHGSVARGETTALSDVDLVVVAREGRRAEIWADREKITRRLLGADPVNAHEVPHQRPYRWQARTADLRTLDLAVDEGSIEMWPGLAGEVEFLVDRGDLRRQRQEWLAGSRPPAYDVRCQDDETWAILSWLAGGLLHGRVWPVWWGITDLIGRRILPVSGDPGYSLGAAAEDAPLVDRVQRALPASLERSELARSLQRTAHLYRDLLAEWAARTGSPPLGSPLAPAVLENLDRLVAGRGERLA